MIFTEVEPPRQKIGELQIQVLPPPTAMKHVAEDKLLQFQYDVTGFIGAFESARGYRLRRIHWSARSQVSCHKAGRRCMLELKPEDVNAAKSVREFLDGLTVVPVNEPIAMPKDGREGVEDERPFL